MIWDRLGPWLYRSEKWAIWAISAYKKPGLAISESMTGNTWKWVFSAVVTAQTPFKRAAPMLGLLAIRLVSLVYRVTTKSGSLKGAGLALGMEIFAISGAIINVSRWPEKFVVPKQGRTAGIFDYWLNSHQIMHILVLISLILKYLAVEEDYRYAYSSTSQCSLGLVTT